MHKIHMRNLIEGIEKWAQGTDWEMPAEHELITEFKTFVIREMYDHNYESLKQLRSTITPIAAELRDRNKSIPLSHRQASEISVINNIVQGILFIMEQDDPEHAAKLIKHGDKILKIITDMNDSEIKLDAIREQWPGVDPSPSGSTISRALGALEEAGFVQRSGATKGRSLRLTPKAKHWAELNSRKVETRLKNAFESLPKTGIADDGDDIMFIKKYETPQNQGFFDDFKNTVNGN